MVWELETANLRGVTRVSQAWRPRLTLLCTGLPLDVSRLGKRLSPTQVLDFVFDVQELLFALKRSRLDGTPAATRWRRWARSERVEVHVLRRPGVHRVPVRVAWA